MYVICPNRMVSIAVVTVTGYLITGFSDVVIEDD